MDYQRAEKALREYEGRVNAYDGLSDQELIPELRIAAHKVNGVLRRLTPDHDQVTGKTLGDHRAAVDLAQQALAVIGATKQLSAAEAESGYPVLPMNLLDPVIHPVAIGYWRAGRYRTAVAEAS